MTKHSSAASESTLRVSVATLDRVVFPHPQEGSPMLALERKASVAREGGVQVRAQPFGGGVRILNPAGLETLAGPIVFDSQRSQGEQDFRILIRPADWEAVRQYCLQWLANPNQMELESTPQRELVEEFAEVLGLQLKPEQYSYQPGGFVVENDPRPTGNVYAPGRPTVRIYRIFEVRMVDDALSKRMLAASQQYSDVELGRLVRQDFESGGRGRANAILTLPLDEVIAAYRRRPAAMRYQTIRVADHALDESVLAILDGVEAPQFERRPDRAT
jgi:hypothetical protein